MEKPLKQLKNIGKKIHLMTHTYTLLEWDQETVMPRYGIRERSEQIALLKGTVHTMTTDPLVGRLLEDLGATRENPLGDSALANEDRALIRLIHRMYSRAAKIPNDLVQKIAKHTSISQSLWRDAKVTSDFSIFAPGLEALLALIRHKADAIGYQEHPYDALIDEFEPGFKTSRINYIFNTLEKHIKVIQQHIEKKADRPGTDCLLGNYSIKNQLRFGKLLLDNMGFDSHHGRLDTSAHPITFSIGAKDVRLTTTYSKECFCNGIFGILHEGGHGLYELGFKTSIQGNLLAQAASMAIHEAQARTWENIIGKSKFFWQHYLPLLASFFPQTCKNISFENLYQSLTEVKPTVLRGDADEVTYNLHIMLRFDLEKKLLNGELNVVDLPEAWNQKTMELLGVMPKNDAQGVLQDIHWSMGIFGYFPVYVLGNLYAAQFYQAMKNDIPNLETHISEGRLPVVTRWMNKHIHSPGSIFTAEELIEKVTGCPLDSSHFTGYLDKKYTD